MQVNCSVYKSFISCISADALCSPSFHPSNATQFDVLDLSMQSSSLLNSFSKLRNDLRGVFCAKNSRTSNDDISTSVSSHVDSLLGETTVDFDVELGVTLAEVLDLGHHVGHEFLATETGFYGHDEDHL